MARITTTRSRTLAIMSLSLLSSPTLATTFRSEETPCPLCTKTVEILQLTSYYTPGGLPPDFLYSPAFPSTCPHCGFTGYPRDYDRKLTDDQRTLLSNSLKPRPRPTTRPDGSTPISGPDDRLQLVKIYQLLNDPPEQIAREYHIASFAYRRPPTLDMFPPDTSAAVDQILRTWHTSWRAPKKRENRSTFDLRQADLILTSDRATFHELLAAICILRTNGENQSTLPALPLLSKHTTPAAFNAYRQNILDSITEERRLQRLALESYERAKIAPPTPANQAATILYLRAELHRRLNHPRQARACYDTAIATTPDDDLKTLAKSQRALVQDD